jgi:hypothetical protein
MESRLILDYYRRSGLLFPFCKAFNVHPAAFRICMHTAKDAELGGCGTEGVCEWLGYLPADELFSSYAYIAIDYWSCN